jgi:hypothetical protein
VKIATKDFVQGIVAPEARVFVDVDVFTTDDFSANDSASVKQWAEMAHKHEKIEFFHLLREPTINKLKAG